MIEQCSCCGKHFDNSNENTSSSLIIKHLCVECAFKIIEKLDNEISKLDEEIKVLKKYNVMNSEFQAKQKIYDTFVEIRYEFNKKS